MTGGDDESVRKLEAEIEGKTTNNVTELARSAWTIVTSWETQNPNRPLPLALAWERAALGAYAVRRENRPSKESRDAYTGDGLDLLVADENAVEYLVRRAERTSNLAAKARYADLAWIAGRIVKRRDAHQFATAAIEAYLALISRRGEEEFLGFTTQRLDRAGELACELGSDEHAALVVRASFAFLDALAAEERARWVLEVFETSDLLGTRFPGLLSAGDWSALETMLLEAAQYFGDDPSRRHLAREALGLAARASQRAAVPERACAHRLRIVNSLEEEARAWEASRGAGYAVVPMKAAILFSQQLLSEPLPAAVEGSLRARLAGFRRELRRLLRKAEDELGAHRMKIPVAFPHEEWEKVIASILQQKDRELLASLVAIAELQLDMRVIQAAVDASKDSTLTRDLAATSFLRQGRERTMPPVAEDSTEEFRSYLHLWFQRHLMNLEFLFSRLQEAERLTLPLFLEYFEAWSVFDPIDRPFLATGIERFLAGDFVSAVHVLVPRIEHMLKSAFEQMGLPPIAVASATSIREQTLGDFLRRPDVRAALGDDLWRYLDFSLVDDGGINLRNEVAHGWLYPKECNHGTASFVIFIVLKIAALEESTHAATESPTGREQGDEGGVG